MACNVILSSCAQHDVAAAAQHVLTLVCTNCPQAELFDVCGLSDLVESAVDGYNVTGDCRTWRLAVEVWHSLLSCPHELHSYQQLGAIIQQATFFTINQFERMHHHNTLSAP